MNSLVSFSMWPSYKLVVMFIKPILDRPKSVSLMWPMDVINKLFEWEKKSILSPNCTSRHKHPDYNIKEKWGLEQGLSAFSKNSATFMFVFLLIRFEIPMHNAIVVKVLQGQDCFSKVHPCHFYWQWAHVLEQVGTISPLIEPRVLCSF